MGLKKRTLGVLVLAAALQGCASQPLRDGGASPTSEAPAATPDSTAQTPAGQPAVAVSPAPSAGVEAEPIEAPQLDRLPHTVILGNDRQIAPARRPASRQVAQKGDEVNLNFDQAPIADVVQALMGDLLKLNFTFDQVPKGEVTLRTQGPISKDNVLAILESMLQANGAAMVQDAGGVYRITSQEGLRNVVPGLHNSDSLPQGYGLVVVQLRYIGASEMADILRPVSAQDSLVRVDSLRNLIVLAGTRSQHEGWLEIVRTFDVDYLKGMSLGVFPLEYASVEELYDAMTSLLSSTPVPPTTQQQQGSRPAQPARAGAAGTPVAQAPSAAGASEIAGGALLGSVVRLLPIKRLNTLVVVSPRAHYIETVREWVERLDKAPVSDLEPTLYVYPVQNGQAIHLANLLGGLYGGTGAGTGAAGRRATDTGVAPGLSQSSLTGNRSSSTSYRGTSTGSSGSRGSDLASLPDTGEPSESQLSTQVSIGEQVRVVADERNNALLILAPRRDYRKIEAALRQLDVSPTQVLIEASIVEVTLTDDLEYGLEWTFNNRIGGSTGTGLLNMRTSGGIGARQPGFSYTITNSAGNVQAVLNALASKSLLKVLSSPSLLVQDNHTASIHVGNQQPIQSSQTIVSDDNVVSSIEYKDTGVMLSVTPSANAGGLVGMDIHQTVTDVGELDDATLQRSFLQRQFKSRVSVRSGETVVMGGLIQESGNNGKRGVPLLKDLPLIGPLFSTTTVESLRTELLVMITPRVLSNDADLRAVSDELRNRMQGLRLRPGVVETVSE